MPPPHHLFNACPANSPARDAALPTQPAASATSDTTSSIIYANLPVRLDIMKTVPTICVCSVLVFVPLAILMNVLPAKVATFSLLAVVTHLVQLLLPMFTGYTAGIASGVTVLSVILKVPALSAKVVFS